MDEQRRSRPSREDALPPPASGNGVSASREPPTGLDRLPPPAFPPGARRVRLRRNARGTGERRAAGGADGFPEDAFISPDEPIVRPAETVPEDAFISPDEPIERSGTRIADGAFISPDEPLPDRRGDAGDVSPDDVVVTGIGDDRHMDDATAPDGERSHGDPHVDDLVRMVGRLADALREKGEAGLRTAPDMSRFEASMRAYCVGYLASRREGGEA